MQKAVQGDIGMIDGNNVSLMAGVDAKKHP